VSGTTTKGSDWNLNALIKRDGRTYAVEFDTTTMAAAIATEVLFLNYKILLLIF